MILSTGGEQHTAGASHSGDALLAQVALVVVLLVGFAAVVCWCGAGLAAFVTGHGWISPGVSSGGGALVGLPHHLSDPVAAWPASARASLPGAVVYWACTVFVISLVAGGSVWITRMWRQSRHRGSPLGIAPHAGFAQAADLRRLTVGAPEPGRLTLGRSGRHLIAAEPRVSLAVIGPTGCGKTAGFAIPALLEWKGPIIATSVKADLIHASIEHRLDKGKVWIYDPTESTRRESAGWSPLDECQTWPGAMRIAAWLCEAAQPRVDSVNDGDYWYTQARRALAPYLYAAALSGQTMRDVVRWIDGQEEDEVTKVLASQSLVEAAIVRLAASEQAQEPRHELHDRTYAEELALTRKRLAATDTTAREWVVQDVSKWPMSDREELDARVKQRLGEKINAEVAPQAIAEYRKSGAFDALAVAQSVWAKEERLRGSVFATAENAISAFADPGVGRPAKRCIHFDEWLTGDNTIYVVAASHEQARLRPALTVLVQQALRRAYDLANKNGGTLERPCLALLDEAGNIAPLRDLPAYASTARSHGITLVSVWQDVAQLKTLYGHRAQTVLNNHGAKLFGTGIADDGTLEYVSRLIGDERQTELNVSDDVRGGRRTISEHVNYRRMAPADILRRMRRNEAVLLYRNELPVHLRLRPWYEE
jgi:type IV secretion system protein VirD4